MVTETKFKGVDQILAELTAAAAKGSCKACQFCVDTRKYPDYHQGGEPFYCLIQGNVNPLTFTHEALDREPYPYGPCDDGNWSHTEDDGSRDQIYGCLAYTPKLVESVSYGDGLVTKHWAFMHCLSEAAKLHYDIEDVHSGKAQTKLDELLTRLNTGDFSGYSLY